MRSPSWTARRCSASTAAPLMMIVGGAAAVSEAGARPLGLRDRRRGDAAGQGRARRHRRAARRPHPQHARSCCTAAALIMSVLLIGSSIVTTMLIPPEAFQAGGAADGRALAYLAHEHLGDAFGTHLRPQHDRDPLVRRRLGDGRAAEPRAALPAALRHGARVGASANRPLVLHLHRHHLPRHDPLQRRRRRAGRRLRHRRAGADDLGGARGHARRAARAAAAGSAICCSRSSSSTRRSSTSSSGRKASRSRRCSSSTIVVTSLVSRVAALDRAARARRRARRRRRGGSSSDAERRARSASSPTGPTRGAAEEYEHKLREAQRLAPPAAGRARAVPRGAARRRVGVQRTVCTSRASTSGGHRVLRCVSPAIPNAIAALLLYIRDETGQIPHAYFGWTEGNPIAYLLKFLALRRRRHRAGHARGAAADRAESAQAAAHPRRLRRPCSRRFRLRADATAVELKAEATAVLVGKPAHTPIDTL